MQFSRLSFFLGFGIALVSGLVVAVGSGAATQTANEGAQSNDGLVERMRLLEESLSRNIVIKGKLLPSDATNNRSFDRGNLLRWIIELPADVDFHEEPVVIVSLQMNADSAETSHLRLSTNTVLGEGKKWQVRIDLRRFSERDKMTLPDFAKKYDLKVNYLVSGERVLPSPSPDGVGRVKRGS